MAEDLVRKWKESMGMRPGISKWTDKKSGEKFEIKTFIGRLYVDAEMERLSEEYNLWKCDGEQRLSTLGQAEHEFVAARILHLARFAKDDELVLAGVERKELETLETRSGYIGCVGDLVHAGYLREKKIKGKRVVFPTEKLLENQKIPKFDRACGEHKS